MAENITRYPLCWPTGWKRTKASERQRADFGKSKEETYTKKAWGQPDQQKTRRVKSALNSADATGRLEREIDRLGGLAAILSTNQQVRMDGTPRSDLAEPSDVGAAVYFTLNGKAMSLACDKWNRVADNIAALAQHIDALRRIDRYGVGTLDQAFTGYAALPAKGETWRTTLGLALDATPTADDIRAAYRARLGEAHPDRPGGSHDAIASLNIARDEALQAISST